MMIVLISPSAGGKDSILNILSKDGYVKPVISTTSRPMRNGETQGKEYNFVTNEEVNNMLNNNEFIEVRKYTVANGETWVYGVSKNSFDINSDITYGCILDFNGYKQMKQYYRDNNKEEEIISVYIDVPLQERLQRSLSREGEMTDEQCLEVCRRSLDDFKNVVIAKRYVDYIINNSSKNGNVYNAVNSIVDILNERKLVKELLEGDNC